LNNHRQSSQPVTRIRPEPYIATGPNQVWTWDYSDDKVIPIFH